MTTRLTPRSPVENELPDITDITELARLIESHLGAKASILSVNREDREITFLLYGTFLFHSALESRTDIFGLALALAGSVVTRKLLGKEFSLNNDAESIIESLDHADRYCRLALPDKLLETYDALWR